jgi:hypothetical protein
MPMKLLGPLVALLAWVPFASASIFGQTEMRAATVRDHLRSVRLTLREPSAANRALTARTVDAFKGEADWAAAAEAYYALRPALVSRAASLEARLDAALASNTLENDQSGKAMERVQKEAEALRSDYELYLRLPLMAQGPQRAQAQATMRLLSQTGQYPVALAFLDSRMPNRMPFAPLPPAAITIRRP